MKLSTILLMKLGVLMLSACASENKQVENNQNGSYQVSKNTKRLNTIDCKDSDDWYLDGYRVGKSFSPQKQQQFEHRVQYCEQKFGTKISHNIKSYWEQGYKIGFKAQAPSLMKKNNHHSI